MTVPPGPHSAESSDPPAVGRRALGRRGFVVTALAGGTVVGAAAAATQRPGGRGDVATPVDAPTGVTVLAGPGIDVSGTRDSTAALQATVDAAAEGAQLWLPGGLYLVDGITLRRGQVLTGPSGRSYTGRSESGARLRARSVDSAGPVLTVGELGVVTDIAVEGEGRAQPAVRPAGIGVVLERVTMAEASVGFDAAYVSGSILTECQIHQNGTGIKDIVDSIVQSTVINANEGDGISLASGANDNTFLGNKVEWNDGYGVQAFQAEHNVLIGGVIDRNGKAGVRLVECSHSTVVGAVLRRNGRLAEDTPDDDCHLFHAGCTGLVVTGLSTNSGRDDGGTSGYDSPAVALRADGGTDVTITGNDLTGSTSGTAIATAAPGVRGTHLLNAGPGLQAATGIQLRVGVADLAVAGGSTEPAVFAVDAGDVDGPGRVYRLLLSYRSGGTGTRGAAEALVLVGRGDAGAEATLGATDDRIGVEFGPTGPMRVTADVTADGRVLTVSVTNTGAAALRIRLELL
ncbi:right-handed parallel beta-helix repeat-containing protein [Blastococcus tunisiensis]|uniref:Right handed beta helix region n=1 Tax=Blastococcus tunisiensis TaxID=1798228 RepID=A0A1I1YGL6_9ACTN|nr:right-handed parallel beta-helix repeat-containing protein [Blastococcus sp. DSM 46838]SFE18168.1 Right handed beta helix region [Blastococcus sp. DSM 46838]